MSAHGDHDLGHTVAGWTGTAIGVLGSAVLGAAVIATSATLLWLGLAVLVLAAATCWALHLAGWGKPTGPRPPSRQDWRSRDTAARIGHPGCLGCRMAGRGGVPAGSAEDPVPPLDGRVLPGARVRAGSA
ncbi:HGxxPAAW family protein [Streptomyces sp. NPDC088746]|uniref:HGxxPAAW family protein n=1 Tax=Streptomyces sp. NPDC088746 TaxID=3365885 RepID=UPI003803A5F1